MHILYLSPCAQLGGAERVLLDCIASLRAAEPHWKLYLIAGEEGPLLAKARALGAVAWCLPYPARLAGLGSFGVGTAALAFQAACALPAVFRYRARLSQAIARLSPDLIHTNGLKMHLLAVSGNAAPVIWHLHDYVSGRRLIAGLMRLSRKGVSAAVAISQSVAADAARVFRARLPIETMLNGVDLSRFHPSGLGLNVDQLSGMPDAPPGTVRVGLVGTFAKWKGHETFLRALASPELAKLPWRAYIIGGAIYRTSKSQFSLEELNNLADSLGLADRVGFTGFVPDIPAALRSLDIVVHASTAPEPFGLVIAEAMACGRAVIASNGGGAAESVSSGRDGIAIPPGDPASLAAAIHELLLHPAKRARLGNAAQATAAARFDRTRLGPSLSAFYLRIYYQRHPRPCRSSTSTAEIGTAA